VVRLGQAAYRIQLQNEPQWRIRLMRSRNNSDPADLKFADDRSWALRPNAPALSIQDRLIIGDEPRSGSNEAKR
jgi:hypothetical protein